MEIEIAVSKISRLGITESGDTIEIVERPNGGLSIVMAEVVSPIMDKKTISSAIVRKVIGWIGEGVRDGAAARAASDFLFTDHKGMLNACLNIISFDKQSNTIVVTRNNPTPVFIYQDDELNCLSGQSFCIGSSLNIRPVISEIPLLPNTMLVLYSTGVERAGKSINQDFDVCMLIRSLLEDQEPTAEEIADTLLTESIRMDQNSPKDDMSIVAAWISTNQQSRVRKMTVNYPLSNNIDESTLL
jgi:hypothetical protein